MQYSRCSLTRAEYRGKFTYLDLLAMLLVMYSRIPLASLATGAHCQLMAKLFSTSTPTSFSIQPRVSRQKIQKPVTWNHVLSQVGREPEVSSPTSVHFALNVQIPLSCSPATISGRMIPVSVTLFACNHNIGHSQQGDCRLISPSQLTILELQCINSLLKLNLHSENRALFAVSNSKLRCMNLLTFSGCRLQPGNRFLL